MLRTSLLLAASVFGIANAQVNKENSLTPDGYWHNRYHALLCMAAYGQFDETCPGQTFSQESLLRNFPNSTRAPWTVINTFGPTASGAQGYTAVVPEMNKALIIFQGNYELEQSLATDVVGWDALDANLAGICNWFAHNQAGLPGQNCTVNAFALQGYLEAKEETNNWAAIQEQYAGAGLVFSIAGHGLGGMHSLIAAMDLNHQNVAYYHHTYGTPRTFNAAGVWYYNYNFWGESGERGVAGDDTYTEFIPESLDYAHAGTPFYYSGWNNTAEGPDWYVCWNVDDPNCAPQTQIGTNPTEDHYFYFTNVGQCGGDTRNDKTENGPYIDAYVSAMMPFGPALPNAAAYGIGLETTSSDQTVAYPQTSSNAGYGALPQTTTAPNAFGNAQTTTTQYVGYGQQTVTQVAATTQPGQPSLP